MSPAPRRAKKGFCILLSWEDHARLDALCRARRQSKADFLRSAMTVAEAVPLLRTKPLSGAALDRHLAKLRRERRRRPKKSAPRR